MKYLDNLFARMNVDSQIKAKMEFFTCLGLYQEKYLVCSVSEEEMDKIMNEAVRTGYIYKVVDEE